MAVNEGYLISIHKREKKFSCYDPHPYDHHIILSNPFKDLPATSRCIVMRRYIYNAWWFEKRAGWIKWRQTIKYRAVRDPFIKIKYKPHTPRMSIILTGRFSFQPSLGLLIIRHNII